MTRLFTQEGNHVPVTVLKVDGVQVIAQRTQEKDGYTALQLGIGTRKAKRTNRALKGHYAKAKIEPKRKLVEFRVDADKLVELVRSSGLPRRVDLAPFPRFDRSAPGSRQGVEGQEDGWPPR